MACATTTSASPGLAKLTTTHSFGSPIRRKRHGCISLTLGARCAAPGGAHQTLVEWIGAEVADVAPHGQDPINGGDFYRA